MVSFVFFLNNEGFLPSVFLLNNDYASEKNTPYIPETNIKIILNLNCN